MRKYKIQRQNDVVHVDGDYYKINGKHLEIYQQEYNEPKIVATIKNWEYILDLKSQEITLSKDMGIPCLGRNGEFVIISDQHAGAESYDEVHALETRSYIKDREAKVVLNGDIIENSIVSGSAPGEKLIEQKLIPTEQMKYAVDMYKPLAKAGLILGVTRGNHEARSRREALVDLSDILAHSLGVPYMGHGGLLRIRHGSQVYTLGIHHGSGFSTNTWRELDRMMALYPQADVVAAGHDHNFCTREQTSIQLTEDGEEEIRVVHQVRTGTYLKYADYARGRMLTPTPTGSPILRFSNSKHQVIVDVNTLRWYS